MARGNLSAGEWARAHGIDGRSLRAWKINIERRGVSARKRRAKPGPARRSLVELVPKELRRMLYTTNAVESLNSQLRKTLRQCEPFPNDEAVFKLLFLAIRNAKVHWKRPVAWTRVLVQLDIFFEGRLPA
jgi:transposase-like protein